MYTARLWFLFGCLLAVAPASAQTVPLVTSAYETEFTVDGTADAAAGPIIIVDLSYEVETRIGTGDVARDGKFAAVVKPALIKGNRLVAVDKNGRRSHVFSVAPARPGPVPGPQP